MAKHKTYSVSIARRVTAILLIAVYLVLSIGILKATHFCMGREASVAFFTTESQKCVCSQYMGEKNSCCDDEQELVKLDSSQKIISVLSLNLPQWMVIEKIYTEQLVAFHTNQNTDRPAFINDSPPPVPLFKIYCSFVFYDDELSA